MTIVRALGTAAAAAVLSVLSAGQAPAQSLLSTSGLGTPLEPVDARARALGGLAVGLPDAQMSLVNPAAAMGLPAAGLTVTFQADEVSGTAGDQAQDYTTARFPVVQAAFPIGTRFVASLGYAGVLDQNWAVEHRDSILVTGQQLDVLDRFRSSGGVARLRGGVGYRLLPRLDVGAALDVYTGALRDTVYRVFTEGGIQPSITGTTYEWRGLGLSAGARWRGSAFSLSAAVAAGGSLTAEAQDSGVVSKDYSLPVQVDVGGSARIAQQALVAVSARWQGWGAADEDVSGGARDATQLTAGIEYEALRFLGRPVPLRIGARYAELPFRYEGATDFVNERTGTAGIGVVFGGGAASLDLSGERGMRGGGAALLDESFWRVSLSLSLLGR
ncbi:hypothetical protein [Longimicrobium sp.]|uniref:hypothetical protein n=1 Tax=Longimicrobium sp. TaxID=2029185 RepID=UPI003B3B50C3